MLAINYPRAYTNTGAHAANRPVRRPARSDVISTSGGRFTLGGVRFRLFFASFVNGAAVIKSDPPIQSTIARLVGDGKNGLRLRSINTRYWTESASNWGIWNAINSSGTKAEKLAYSETALVQLDRTIAFALDGGIECIYIDLEGYDEIVLRNELPQGTFEGRSMQWSDEWADIQWAANSQIMERVSTVTGVRYIDNPRIIWNFNNECGFSNGYLRNSYSTWGGTVSSSGANTISTAIITALDPAVVAKVRKGFRVTGTGISGTVTILSVDSTTQITLTANTSTSGTRTFTFTCHWFDKIIEGITDSTGNNDYWYAEMNTKLLAYATTAGWTVPNWGRGNTLDTTPGNGTQGFPTLRTFLAWGTAADQNHLLTFIENTEYDYQLALARRVDALGRTGVVMNFGTMLYQTPRFMLATPPGDVTVKRFMETHDYFPDNTAVVGVQTGSSVSRKSVMDRTWSYVTNGGGWNLSMNGVRNADVPFLAGECGQYGPNRWRHERIIMEGIFAQLHGYEVSEFNESQQWSDDQYTSDGRNMSADHVNVSSSCSRLVSRAMAPAIKLGFLDEHSSTFTFNTTTASYAAFRAANGSVGFPHGAGSLIEDLGGISGSENAIFGTKKLYWTFDDGVAATTVITTTPACPDATLAAGTYLVNTGDAAGCTKVYAKRGDPASETLGLQWMSPYWCGWMDTISASPVFSQMPMKFSSLSATEVCGFAILRSDGLWPLFTGAMKLFMGGSDFDTALVDRNSSYASSGGIGAATFMANDVQTLYYDSAGVQSWTISGSSANQRQMVPESLTVTIDTTNNGLLPAGTDLEIFGVTAAGLPVRLASTYDSGTKVWTWVYAGTYPEYTIQPKSTSTVALSKRGR